MKKSRRNLFCSILTICMILSIALCKPASAMVQSSAYLDWYKGALTPEKGGGIALTVKVEACGDMHQVGASKIVLFESSDGEKFTQIKIYEYEDYPLMMGSGWFHAKDVATYQGTPGYAYYAIFYCYAGDANGHDEKTYTTSVVYARG